MHIVHLEDERPQQEILKLAIDVTIPQVKLYQFVRGDEVLPHTLQHKDVIDLFILDIRVIGSLSGLQVAKKIRDYHCTSPIILTSAYMQPNQDLLRLLQCQYVPKPWSLEQMINSIMKLTKSP